MDVTIRFSIRTRNPIHSRPTCLSLSVIDTCIYMYRRLSQTNCRGAARLSSRLLLARRGIGRQCGFEFLQIGREVGNERRMRAQSGKVREGSRILSADTAMNDWFEAFFLEFAGPCALVEEQAQLGREADIREGEVVSYQVFTAGR